MRTKENTRDNAGGAGGAHPINNLIKSLEPAIKVISERINEFTERVGEAVRQLEIFKIEYEKEYNKIRTKFNAHFNKEGFVVDDADDFLFWLRCKNDSKPEVNLIEEAKKPSNYKLYHEYNLKCLYDDWDIIKELDYWDKQQTEQPGMHNEEAKKQMDLNRLDNLFNPQKIGNDKLLNLKKDLLNFAPRSDKKQRATLALIIYENLLHDNVKAELKSFKNWQELFCEILGVEESTYKPAIITEKEKTEMKSTYYYLFT